MKYLAGRTCAVVVTLASAGLCSADIIGFNNLNGWHLNQADAASPPVLINSDSIQITDGNDNRRSLWHTTPQDITEFTAGFTYRAGDIAASAHLQGLAFVIHRSPNGLNALGSGASALGYGGISPSAAVTIAMDTGPARTYSGFYSNGVIGGGLTNLFPVNAFTHEEIDVDIVYSGSVLSVTMTQGANVFGPRNYVVGSLSTILGGSTAYVGFTAATFNTLGSGGGADQYLSNFRFDAVPEPTACVMLLLASAGAVLRRRA